MSEQIEIVEAVMATETVEKTWIPPTSKATFFGEYDIWMYNAVLDDKLCNDCLEHEKTPRYFGSQLRTEFPYLEIVDDNTIMANIHPNCRCTLTRITEWTLDDIKWFVTYVGD